MDCLYLFTEFQIISRLFGVPLAPEKSVSPTTCLDFFGVQINTVAMEFRLPMDTIVKTRLLLEFILFKKKVQLRTIQTLLGLLAFASRVMPMGRVFSKCLYRAVLGITFPTHFARVTTDIRDDLLIWHKFLSSFNSCFLWQAPFCVSSALNLCTDASGACGYRAFWQGRWSTSVLHSSWVLLLISLFPVSCSCGS